MLRILKTLSLLSGSRGPHGPDLPSPCGRKFHISHLVSQVANSSLFFKSAKYLKDPQYFLDENDTACLERATALHLAKHVTNLLA